MTTPRATVRLSLDMSPEANQLLEELALAGCTTKSHVMRKAIALFHLATKAQLDGQQVAFLDRNNNLVKEIVGI